MIYDLLALTLTVLVLAKSSDPYHSCPHVHDPDLLARKLTMLVSVTKLKSCHAH